MSEKTRNYYLRNWCYVVVGRSMKPERFGRFGLAVGEYRKNCDFGLYCEVFDDIRKIYNCVYVAFRKRKKLRFDTLGKAFAGFYITRLPEGQFPSEVCEKFLMKHHAKYDDSVVYICDKKNDCSAVDDEYLIKFDENYIEVLKNE